MAAMRGLTWGSSEFVELAKASEKRGEMDEHVKTLYETVGDISVYSDQLTEKQRRDLRIIMADIFEMVGD